MPGGPFQPIAMPLLMALMLPASPVGAASTQEELRALHEKVMRAHRENNVDLLLEDGAADSVEANRGEIRRPSPSETRARFSSYLRDTRFETYRDVVEPIVVTSADGSLGWVIVQVEARGVQLTGTGGAQPLHFTSAWIELYQNRNGRWYRIGNVSNFKPQGEPDPQE